MPLADPRLLQDHVPNDFSTWPWPCKRYTEELPRVELVDVAVRAFTS